MSVDTEDTVRSVLTVLELVLDPWRPELELLAGVTLVLELDIVTCLRNTLTISCISKSTLSLYLHCHYIYESISPYLYEYHAWYPCQSQLSVQIIGRWREHCI